VQHQVAVGGKTVETLDHAQGAEHGPGGLGADVRHSEELFAPQLLFDIRDDFRELGVGIQQLFKVLVFQPEDVRQVFTGLRVFSTHPSKGIEFLQHTGGPFALIP